MMSAQRTLPSAVLPILPPPSPRKMHVTFDPNMKVSEDDPTLDLGVIDGARPPATPKTGLIAFFALLSFAYVVAIVATIAVTGAPAIALLHQLRSAI